MLIKTHMPKKDQKSRRRSGWTSWWRGTGDPNQTNQHSPNKDETTSTGTTSPPESPQKPEKKT